MGLQGTNQDQHTLQHCGLRTLDSIHCFCVMRVADSDSSCQECRTEEGLGHITAFLHARNRQNEYPRAVLLWTGDLEFIRAFGRRGVGQLMAGAVPR